MSAQYDPDIKEVPILRILRVAISGSPHNDSDVRSEYRGCSPNREIHPCSTSTYTRPDGPVLC